MAAREKVFIDADFIAGLAGREIRFPAGQTGDAVVASEHVMRRAVSLVARRHGDGALEKAEKRLSRLELEMIFPKVEDVEECWKNARKLGLSDFHAALTVSLMKKAGVKKIISSNEFFDRVPGIKRVT